MIQRKILVWVLIAIVAFLLLATLTSCGSPRYENDQELEELQGETNDFIEHSIDKNTEFYVEEVTLPDGSTVICIAARDALTCDWR